MSAFSQINKRICDLRILGESLKAEIAYTQKELEQNEAIVLELEYLHTAIISEIPYPERVYFDIMIKEGKINAIKKYREDMKATDMYVDLITCKRYIESLEIKYS